MRILQTLALLIAFISTNAFAVTVIKESRPDEDIKFVTSPGGVSTEQGQIDGATGNLGFDNITNAAGSGAPNFPFGATGISASITDFTVQSIVGSTLTLNGGTIRQANGREILTYDGTGATSGDFGGNITVDLDTVLGSSPANATTYYLYIAPNTLTETILTDNNRAVYGVTEANLILTTNKPEVQGTTSIYLATITSATTGNSWDGAGSSVVSAGTKSYAAPNVTVSPTVYQLAKQAVGSVGSAGQINAGHVLTDDSFRAYVSDISYYNLNDLNDDSLNSRNLTNNNSVAFTGTDIFGVAGIAAFGGTNSLDSNDAFFTAALSTAFSLGGWFNADDWGAAGTLVSVWNGAPNVGPRIEVFSDVIRFSASSDGTNQTLFDVSTSNLTDNTWHHIAMSHDGTNLIGYIDGLEIGRAAFAAQAAITATFSIGSRYASGSPGDYFTGEAQDVFFTSDGLSAAEIKRLYAAKITHGKNVQTENQVWTGTYFDASDDLVGEFDQDWIVHKNANSVWLDLALSATSSVALKMQDQSFTTTSVPIETYYSGLLTSAPSFPIAHGLPCPQPQDFYVLTEGQSIAGEWDKRYDLLSVDGTNITGSLGSLTIDATHRLQIVASCAPIAVSVPFADEVTVGTVSTSTQTFAGVKTFTGNVGIGTDTITMSANKGLTLHDGTSGVPRIQLTNPTSGQAEFDGADIIYSSDLLMTIREATGNIGFRTNSLTRMTIDNTGKVGIGTTSPLSPLHVQQSEFDSNDDGIILDGTSQGSTRMYLDTGVFKIDKNGTTALEIDNTQTVTANKLISDSILQAYVDLVITSKIASTGGCNSGGPTITFELININGDNREFFEVNQSDTPPAGYVAITDSQGNHPRLSVSCGNAVTALSWINSASAGSFNTYVYRRDDMAIF